MRSRLALTMAAAIVVAAPLVTAATASAGTLVAKGQTIKAAPAAERHKHCGYPASRVRVYLGPISQTIHRGQRAAAVGWAGCNHHEIAHGTVGFHVSRGEGGSCTDTNGRGGFTCSTSKLQRDVSAYALVKGHRSNVISVNVKR